MISKSSVAHNYFLRHFNFCITSNLLIQSSFMPATAPFMQYPHNVKQKPSENRFHIHLYDHNKGEGDTTALPALRIL